MHKLWKTPEMPHKPRVYSNLKGLKPFTLSFKNSLKTCLPERPPIFAGFNVNRAFFLLITFVEL